MLGPRHHSRSKGLVLITALLFCGSSALADVETDFLLFPQVDALVRTGLDDAPLGREGLHDPLEDDQFEAGVDLFLTLESGRFRFLGEYLLSTEEQEFERFQLGWDFGGHMAWLGRFHNPLGYWNTRYHHGAFIQTSISRPAIVAYEEHGGILPMHQAGLLVEGGLFSTPLSYQVALATVPGFDGELHAWDILDPGAGEQDTSLTLNLFRAASNGQYGIAVNYNEIPSEQNDLDEIRQWILGGYFDQEWGPWQLHASAYYVSNRLSRPLESEEDQFLSGYLQAEYQAGERLRLFARAEGTAGASSDAYLALFAHFVEQRLMGGVRFDLAHNNALKFEVSTNQTRTDDFGQFMLQWSAQF
jgi:hypothetical protein